MLDQGDLKIAFLSGNGGDFRQGVELDIDVPADLDQFGRDNSHGTIVGGEGLIELGHHPPDGAGFLHQMNIISRIRHIQGGLHPGDAAPHNQDGAQFLC
jgi:hypothetical protein